MQRLRHFIDYRLVKKAIRTERTQWIWGLAGLVVAAILDYYHPFVLPQLSLADKWVVVLWGNHVLTAIIGFLISVCLGLIFQGRTQEAKFFVKLGIYVSLAFFLLAEITIAYQTYFFWKDHPLGKYLLPPHSAYFFLVLWRFALPFLLGMATGIILGVLFALLAKITRERLLDWLEVMIGIWMGVAIGWERSFAAIIFTLFLALLGFLFLRERHLRLAPFLLMAMFMAMFSGLELTKYIFRLPSP